MIWLHWCGDGDKIWGATFALYWIEVNFNVFICLIDVAFHSLLFSAFIFLLKNEKSSVECEKLFSIEIWCSSINFFVFLFSVVMTSTSSPNKTNGRNKKNVEETLFTFGFETGDKISGCDRVKTLNLREIYKWFRRHSAHFFSFFSILSIIINWFYRFFFRLVPFGSWRSRKMIKWFNLTKSKRSKWKTNASFDFD